MSPWSAIVRRLRRVEAVRPDPDTGAPRFDRVLREVIEREGGLVLGLASFERMILDRGERLGTSDRLRDVILRRSRKILAPIARLVRAQEERA